MKLLSSEHNLINNSKLDNNQVNFKEENQQDEAINQDRTPLTIKRQTSNTQRQTTSFHDGSTRHIILKASPQLGPQPAKQILESVY